ncbi:virulence factor TspB C-terminal domain-related protein [Acinetobacter baumannii]|uniref:virulence factor TspB C-terminal domain-related protein n=1 Tax=Acinetobacter baumannii TaxID=470 RepID=UPI002FE56C08
MRNLKYLIFIIISLFSATAFADYYVYYINTGNINTGYQTSYDAACNKYVSMLGTPTSNVRVSGIYCVFDNMQGDKVISTGNIGITKKLVTAPPITCPNSGSPVPTYFEPNTPIPVRVCKQNADGTYCIYDAADKNNPLVISTGNYQSITLSSVSAVPSPSCTPQFSKTSCDPKDPYGGCYQPPDDNCNRMADGSIYCPEGTPPPPIQSGCSNNATYCDMPPTGCGSNYVPGNFNGKQICVKNSNPPPTDPIDQPPDPEDPPPPDPNDPPPASSPPPALPPDNNGPILRAILDAVNAVNNKLTWLKNELVNSLNYIAKKIDGTNAKLDTANQKLDTVNDSVKATTAAVNANGDKIKAAVDANATTVKTAVDANTSAVKGAVEANTTSTANKLNEVVNAINNKPVGGGGTAVNLEPTNNLLKGIQDWLAVSDDTNPEDGEIKVVKNEIDTNFDGNLVNATGTCPQPMQISFSIVQTYTIQFSYETFCLGASLARPWIIFVGMLTAFFIVTGHYRGGSND